MKGQRLQVPTPWDLPRRRTQRSRQRNPSKAGRPVPANYPSEGNYRLFRGQAWEGVAVGPDGLASVWVLKTAVYASEVCAPALAAKG
jgi:hypothetical protein